MKLQELDMSMEKKTRKAKGEEETPIRKTTNKSQTTLGNCKESC